MSRSARETVFEEALNLYHPMSTAIFVPLNLTRLTVLGQLVFDLIQQ